MTFFGCTNHPVFFLLALALLWPLMFLPSWLDKGKGKGNKKFFSVVGHKNKKLKS
jgi:hypothetical protein